MVTRPTRGGIGRVWRGSEAGEDGGDGVFGVLLVTEDGQRHTVSPSAASAEVLMARWTSRLEFSY